MKALYKERIEKGLVERKLYTRPEHWPRIKALADKLNNRSK